MVRLVYVLTICVFFSLTKGLTHDKAVVCYYEYESELKIERVDLNLCSHVIAIDRVWGERFEISEDPWSSSRDKSKDYARLTRLRLKWPRLKILLALKRNFRDYLEMAKQRNQIFVKNATEFAINHQFDGIDLLWDFSRYQDYNYKYLFDEKYNEETFINFIKSLKTNFASNNLTLTTTIIAVHEKILLHLSMFELSKHFDSIHFLQWYIFAGSNLHKYQLSFEMRSMRIIQDAIDTAIALGAQREKIILGIQFLPSVFDNFSGVEKFGYATVCDLNGKYNIEHGLNAAKKPLPMPLWTFLPDFEQYIFESGRSIANKVRFAVRRNLGGIMAFPINYDDSDGSCRIENNTFIDYKAVPRDTLQRFSTFPLLHTINNAILVAKKEKSDENRIGSESKIRNGSFENKNVVCYTLTKPDRKLSSTPIENVDLNLCTHLICIDDIWSTAESEEPWRKSTGKIDYKRFTNLRQTYPHLNIAMAVKHSLAEYFEIVNDSERRREFIENWTEFALNSHFDGLNMVWDLSKARSLTPTPLTADDNIYNFINDLSTSLHSKSLSLTLSFIGIDTQLAKSLNILSLSEHVDLINFLQLYDFRAYSGKMAFGMLNVTNQMRMFDNLIEMGVSPMKIAMGIQFLAHKFNHREDVIEFEETMGMSRACEIWKKNRVANILMRRNSQPKTIEFETFDALARKVAFVRSRNLAGIVILPVNTDDFLEKCGENNAKNPFDDYENSNPYLRIVYQEMFEETKGVLG
ncbi:probable chitinase 2 [Contarinia nasturtii]|uniref:probable chitinase 2 n=1 Tax=Contarinia nasturtii TaxID=265458 RepID=UPI0012D40312|nr:probable chitinase 2 [Contarinia nasturtii]